MRTWSPLLIFTTLLTALLTGGLASSALASPPVDLRALELLKRQAIAGEPGAPSELLGRIERLAQSTETQADPGFIEFAFSLGELIDFGESFSFELRVLARGSQESLTELYRDGPSLARLRIEYRAQQTLEQLRGHWNGDQASLLAPLLVEIYEPGRQQIPVFRDALGTMLSSPNFLTRRLAHSAFQDRFASDSGASFRTEISERDPNMLRLFEFAGTRLEVESARPLPKQLAELDARILNQPALLDDPAVARQRRAQAVGIYRGIYAGLNSSSPDLHRAALGLIAEVLQLDILGVLDPGLPGMLTIRERGADITIAVTIRTLRSWLARKSWLMSDAIQKLAAPTLPSLESCAFALAGQLRARESIH